MNSQWKWNYGVTLPAFLTTIRTGGTRVRRFIGAGLVFGSAGVPPVGLRGVKAHKITGETPALPKPFPKS
jgi:hypothetical protein